MDEEAVTPDARVWVDVTQTCRTRANTGVQRVVREVLRSLGSRAVPVRWSRFTRSWVSPGARQAARLHWDSEIRPGARRSSMPRIVDRWIEALNDRAFNKTPPPAARCFLTAEVFSPEAGANLPELPRRVAIFHDALPLRLPHLFPPATLERFPLYMRQLHAFCEVLAVSEASRLDLLAYGSWLGGRQPRIGRVELPVRLPRAEMPPGPQESLNVLCIGTFEPRKNHLMLLDAAESLWARGLRFKLDLAGAPHPSPHGREVEARIRALRRRGRPLVHHRCPSDRELARLLASAGFTVFPSLAEGYGLPVAESLAAGVPCICSAQGATGEIASAGGCRTFDPASTESVCEAIFCLLEDRNLRVDLARQAALRKFPDSLKIAV